MSDMNSGLPIRSQIPGQVNYDDILVKIADATTPSQQLTINVDGSINITDNAGSLTVDAVDLDIRDLDSAQDSVEVLQATHDNLNANANIQVADVDVSNANPVPVSDAGGSLTVDAVNLDIRDLTHASDSVKVGDGTDFLAINNDGSINITDNGGSLTVDAVDLDIRDLSAAQDNVAAWISDETGAPFSETNPLPVYLTDNPGTAVQNYNTAASIAAGATSNHDYAVPTGIFELLQVQATSSGKMKIEIQHSSDGVSFTTLTVGFNSPADPNIDTSLKAPYNLTGGASALIRVIRTNKDGQSQDLYSTIVGLLK